jgi:hypothetical protein
MFGSYVKVEEADSDFTAEHFPSDGNGNYYSAFRTDPAAVYEEADLRYEGPTPPPTATPTSSRPTSPRTTGPT